MALLAIEGHFRNGKVELVETPSGVHSSRVVVTFLPEDSASHRSALDREEAVKRLFVLMDRGMSLGGGPYYKNREEIYDERLARFEQGDR